MNAKEVIAKQNAQIAALRARHGNKPTTKPKPKSAANVTGEINGDALVRSMWQQFARNPQAMLLAMSGGKDSHIVSAAMREYHACCARLEARIAANPGRFRTVDLSGKK